MVILSYNNSQGISAMRAAGTGPTKGIDDSALPSHQAHINAGLPSAGDKIPSLNFTLQFAIWAMIGCTFSGCQVNCLKFMTRAREDPRRKMPCLFWMGAKYQEIDKIVPAGRGMALLLCMGCIR
jgi:hypothetical protein